MLVKGELKCLHCGFMSARWIGKKGSPLTVAGIPDGQRREGADPLSAARCYRCEGPVFLDEADPVLSISRLRRIRRLRAQIAAIDAERTHAA